MYKFLLTKLDQDVYEVFAYFLKMLRNMKV